MSLLRQYELFPSIRSAFGDTPEAAKTAAEELKVATNNEGHLASVSIFTDELKTSGLYGTNVLTHCCHLK